MIIPLFFTLITLNFVLLEAITQEPLLQMSQNFNCIKQVINDFIKKQTCQELTQSQKTILAMQMTNCLNMKMGKPTIPNCNDLKQCKIQGDDWNTFTSFFTHIDNLCHFYWDLLHHERTEKLVHRLSESAVHAQGILKENYKSTQKILSTQTKIQFFMEDSLTSTKELSKSLSSSQEKLQNMTQNIQVFFNQINRKIIMQYSSISRAMETISQGIDGLNNVQSFMISEINSISGIVYFCLKILLFFILTSFESFRKNRIYGFFILFANILVQITVPNSILILIGIKLIRQFFAFLIILSLIGSVLSKETKFEKLKKYIDGRLDTKRMKRIFKQIIDENQVALLQKIN